MNIRRCCLILLIVSLTASSVIAQAQEPKSSTDTIFHGSPQGTIPRDTWGMGDPNPDRIVRARKPTPMAGPKDAMVSITSLAAPKEAKAAFDKAMREIDKGDSANLLEAKQNLEKAVAEYPEYAVAWTKLGQVNADLGDADAAIVALEKSVELDERFLLPYDYLVWLYTAKEDWDHATQLTKLALDINPADVKMRWYQAGCAYESGRDDEAIALFREIQSDAEAAKQFPQSHLFTGLIYARRGQLAKAAADYRLYLLFVPDAPDAEAVKKQLSEWEQLGAI